jgi:nucleoside-diphosphate-sugar epimerase
MKIVITGAAGWIGRAVTAALETDHDLVLVDNADPTEATVFDPSAEGGRRRLPLQTRWPYHRVDILDEDGIAKAVAGAEVVVHLAAWPTGDWSRARATMATNVTGTFNVFECARAAGVRRTVNASSINAYGSFFWRVSGRSPVRRALPLVEDEPIEPEDPYSLSKAMTELIGGTFNRAFAMEVANLRFAGVMPETTYAELLSNGLPKTETWDDRLFQWVHIEDVTQGIVLAAIVPVVVPEPIVLAAADTRAPEPTLELLARYRPELLPYVREPLPGRASLLSIARARTFLGYEPRYSLAATAGSGDA